MKPAAILIHVPDVSAGLAWYQQAFPLATTVYLSEFDFTVLDLNGFCIEIVQADEKVAAGKKGTVLYWAVESLTESLERVYLSSPFLLEAIFYSGKAANLDNSNLYLTFANAVRVKNGPSPSGSA